MAGFFSDEFRERVRAASDIVDVIGGYLPLKRAGANFVALCPFHKEKSPSFNVNPHKQIFHCFGCHKGGDVFTFVKEYENIGFPDAVTRLAERAKIPLEYAHGAPDQQTRHEKDQLLQIHEHIAQRWQNTLATEASGQLARDYLAKRGVSAEASKLFRLGAAPDLWDDTVNWAKSKDYDLALVEKAGLILKREGSEGHYDRFRGRLMFPICDEQGRVIGFSGRVLSGDEKTAKYVNSPETPIFTKSKVFFGLDKSKRAILDAGHAVICEGQLDLIACFMGGVQNVVAPQGTAFTDQHARILKRYTDEVVLCFDADNAGQNAAVRAQDGLLASGLAVRVAQMPAPHDPDSFIKANGGEAFKRIIEAAPDFFEYYLQRLCNTNDITSDKGRLAVLRAMGEAVKKTGNSVIVDNYAQRTALRLGVMPDAVRAEFKKSGRTVRPAPGQSESSEPEAESRSEMPSPGAHEFGLLELLLGFDEAAVALTRRLQPQWIQHGIVREIVTQRLTLQESGGWPGFGAFLSGFDSPDAVNLLTGAVSADRKKYPNPGQQALDVALRLRNQFIDRTVAALTQRASQPGLGEAELRQMLQEQMNLRELKRQPI